MPRVSWPKACRSPEPRRVPAKLRRWQEFSALTGWWAGLSCARAGAVTGRRALRRVRMKAPWGLQLNVQVRGGPGIPGLAAPAGCYLVAPFLAAVPFPAPSSGFMASSRLSANFRWEMSSCSVKS